MKRRNEIEVFGLSFMDLICCGLGGVIILMLILSTLIRQGQEEPAGMAAERKAKASEADRSFAIEIDLSVPESLPLELQMKTPSKEEVSKNTSGLDYSIRQFRDPNVSRYVAIINNPGDNARFDFVLKSDGGIPSGIKYKIRLLSRMTIDRKEGEIFDHVDIVVKRDGLSYQLRVSSL